MFHLSSGNNPDAPEGRKLISNIHSDYDNFLLMDRAYEDDKTRRAATEFYKRSNEVEHFFLCIKRFRKVFTRYDKLDIIYLSVITFAMILDVVF